MIYQIYGTTLLCPGVCWKLLGEMWPWYTDGWRTGTSLVGQKWRWKCPWYDLVATMIWLRGPPTGLVALHTQIRAPGSLFYGGVTAKRRPESMSWSCALLPPQCWHIQAGWGSPIAPICCMAGAC